MRYALLLNPTAEMDPTVYAAAVEKVRVSGTLAGARRFAAAAEATTIRTDGESVERERGGATATPVAGFLLVDCSEEAQALALAGEVAEVTGAGVEVRPTIVPGEGTSERAGVHETTPDGIEYAFIQNVAEADRPWPGDPAFVSMMARCGRVLDDLDAQGNFRGTERLAPAPTAKTVRHSASGRRVVDGPFAEARELIGGFILGVCADEAEALALAALLPGAVYGSVEVRQVVG